MYRMWWSAPLLLAGHRDSSEDQLSTIVTATIPHVQEADQEIGLVLLQRACPKIYQRTVNNFWAQCILPVNRQASPDHVGRWRTYSDLERFRKNLSQGVQPRTSGLGELFWKRNNVLWYWAPLELEVVLLVGIFLQAESPLVPRRANASRAAK